MYRHNGSSLYLLRSQCDSVRNYGREDRRTPNFWEVGAIPRGNRLDVNALGYCVGTWGAGRYIVELTIVYKIDDQDTVVCEDRDLWRTQVIAAGVGGVRILIRIWYLDPYNDSPSHLDWLSMSIRFTISMIHDAMIYDIWSVTVVVENVTTCPLSFLAFLSLCVTES